MPVHLWLAANHVRLGRPDEAKASLAEALRLNPAVSERLVNLLVPFRDASMLAAFLADLRQAGLPEG